eukprot:Tbor_TRINITY_DN5536_c1_g1::TRINITY_DN5536_c1_g1_i1::g.12781::m.12781/K01887/RARS, argS; arginyl-tRNA synthetase
MSVKRAILDRSVDIALKTLFKESIIAAFPTLTPIPEILISQGKLGKGETKPADYQCNNAMAITKSLSTLSPAIKLSPSEVGDTIAMHIPPNDLIDRVESTKQGFINIYIAHTWVCGALDRFRATDITTFASTSTNPSIRKIRSEKVLVDFSSPNIAKEMHVGHLRSTIIGESICRLLEFLGCEVSRINHMGDWGTQFGMLIRHLKIQQPNFLADGIIIPDLVKFYQAAKREFDSDTDGWKEKARLEVVKLQQGDEDSLKAWTMLCDISRKEFDEIYSRLDVSIKERGESFYNPFIPKVLEMLDNAGFTEKSDGATIIVPKEEKDIKDLNSKDFAKLLSNHFIVHKRGGAGVECSEELVILLKEAGLLIKDVATDEDLIKLPATTKKGSAMVTKPLKEFDIQKDIDKLSVAMEPLYLSSNNKDNKKDNKDNNNNNTTTTIHPLLLEAMSKEGIIIKGSNNTRAYIPRFTFPLMALKSDGAYTYDTTDITAMWHRFVVEDHTRVIISTDVGQYEHLNMCAQVATDMGWINNNKYWQHAGFGLVTGEGGKKLKTRSGDTVKLKDLLDEAVKVCYSNLKEREESDNKQGHSDEEMHFLARRIGYSAIKYFDLKQSRTNDYAFDYDKMLSMSGNTAVYMLYSYARINSIREKSEVKNEIIKNCEIILETEQETALALCVLRMESVLVKTAEDLYLNHITDYVFELTSKLSDFYTACRVIGHDNMIYRLAILEVVAVVMKTCLKILGIDVVEKI